MSRPHSKTTSFPPTSSAKTTRPWSIDWAFVGIGAIGEDAGNLVPDAVLDFHVAPEHVGDLYQSVYDGYLAGLRDASWTGSDEIVDLAMRVTIAAKHAWTAPVLRAAVEDRDLSNRRPIEQTFSWRAPLIPFPQKRRRGPPTYGGRRMTGRHSCRYEETNRSKTTLGFGRALPIVDSCRPGKGVDGSDEMTG